MTDAPHKQAALDMDQVLRLRGAIIDQSDGYWCPSNDTVSRILAALQPSEAAAICAEGHNCPDGPGGVCCGDTAPDTADKRLCFVDCGKEAPECKCRAGMNAMDFPTEFESKSLDDVIAETAQEIDEIFAKGQKIAATAVQARGISDDELRTVGTEVSDEIAQARDAALVEAARWIDVGAHVMSHHGTEMQVRSYQDAAKAILALRTQPAPDPVVEAARVLETHQLQLIHAAAMAKHSLACDGEYGYVGHAAAEAAFYAMRDKLRALAKPQGDG